MKNNQFKFGLETEYLLAHSETFEPYWHQNVSFQRLNQILENIQINDLPSCDGLELEAPHRKLMPYVVEGYHLPDMDFKAVDILPKGIEIRTPVCNSISECLDAQVKLFYRLQESLIKEKLVAVALSHHPVESHFKGPQNKRRHDYWLWAMEVMTTYGPDINVGIPEELAKTLDLDDFMAKINYYAAGMTAFSLASPFCEGGLWEIRGKIGKSLRTYRRSVIAPPIEIHPHENNRLEFKIFDMSNDLRDYESYFLLFLTLLLDETLLGRASASSRIYDQGAVALLGWEAPSVMSRAIELLESAERTLPKWGFDINSLTRLENRLRERNTPADEWIAIYQAQGSDLRTVLKYLSVLKGTQKEKSTHLWSYNLTA